MKKNYISPEAKTMKSGLEDFVLDSYGVVGNSQGTNDYWSKDRGNVEDVPGDDDFWSTNK